MSHLVSPVLFPVSSHVSFFLSSCCLVLSSCCLVLVNQTQRNQTFDSRVLFRFSCSRNQNKKTFFKDTHLIHISQLCFEHLNSHLAWCADQMLGKWVSHIWVVVFFKKKKHMSCGEDALQVAIRPCLVPKKFSTVPITSNLQIYAWSIKCGWKIINCTV